jgi:hypothetical protein
MDTTPEYIKQCEKAVPDLLDYFVANIQQLRPMFIYDEVTERVSVLLWSPKSLRDKIDETRDEIIVSIESEKDRNIYIPGDSKEAVSKPIVPLWRQDQLQEIWREEYLKHPSKHGWFGEFCNFMSEPYSDGANADESFDTMEQLWLAFVMKELYGKGWNGEEWVAIQPSGITG